jgi:hypothetical protein
MDAAYFLDFDACFNDILIYLSSFHSILKQSERVHKVLEYVNLIHQYCSVMGMDFFQLVSEVHPSLDDAKGLPKSISNDTLDLLLKTIQSLGVEKKRRLLKVLFFCLSSQIIFRVALILG